MNIGLINVDKTRFMNLALGKIAAYHRSLGDSVEWADPMFGSYDRVYASKVFVFTPDFTDYYDCEVVKGGTGYDIHSLLSDEIDRLQPDYSIYPDIDSKTAYGFLTRGCPNRCKWCIVPLKEGNVHPYMDIEEDLKAHGFDVIVFVPSYDEDNGLITCGNAILSGKLPTSEYEIIENNV